MSVCYTISASQLQPPCSALLPPHLPDVVDRTHAPPPIASDNIILPPSPSPTRTSTIVWFSIGVLTDAHRHVIYSTPVQLCIFVVVKLRTIQFWTSLRSHSASAARSAAFNAPRSRSASGTRSTTFNGAALNIFNLPASLFEAADLISGVPGSGARRTLKRSSKPLSSTFDSTFSLPATTNIVPLPSRSPSATVNIPEMSDALRSVALTILLMFNLSGATDNAPLHSSLTSSIEHRQQFNFNTPYSREQDASQFSTSNDAARSTGALKVVRYSTFSTQCCHWYLSSYELRHAALNIYNITVSYFCAQLARSAAFDVRTRDWVVCNVRLFSKFRLF
ncbi:hypothetical protein C8R45DRAFT_1074615 [Mycena sanguinolenta]|nr:hypothetical protein C8R45DRAFT_1074613 [Mycena sanguinolenta]KAJ6486811.1 hypothetical protein C8R45DRAFT_1074615 [Mycena sanguinolenta]